MRQQIRNIAQPKEDIRRVGVVEEVFGINVRVRDTFDRVWIAEIGLGNTAIVGDTVVVRNGTVVSKTSSQNEPIIFEV